VAADISLLGVVTNASSHPDGSKSLACPKLNGEESTSLETKAKASAFWSRIANGSGVSSCRPNRSSVSMKFCGVSTEGGDWEESCVSSEGTTALSEGDDVSCSSCEGPTSSEVRPSSGV
jgi:hypothetical protein